MDNLIVKYRVIELFNNFKYLNFVFCVLGVLIIFFDMVIICIFKILLCINIVFLIYFIRDDFDMWEV